MALLNKLVTVNRENLLNALHSVQPGLATRETIEQSTCFIFRKGKVWTFNEEIACSIPSGLDKSFQGAVASKKLTELLEKTDDDEIRMEQANGELLISGKGWKSGIRMEQEILLAIDSVESAQDWKELPSDFVDGLNIVSDCASSDASRFEATCIHFHPKWIEACDRTQLARYTMKTGVGKSFLVRRDSIKHVASLGLTEIAQTETWVHFRNAKGLILSCRRFMDEYPDLTKLLDVHGEQTVLPSSLAEAVQKAEIFSSENSEVNRVLVEIRPGKMRVKGQGVTGWYWKSKPIKYKGKALGFLIAPKLLVQITDRSTHCEITPERLKVTSDKWTFIACLAKPEEVEEQQRESVKKKEEQEDEE